jgi:hypothetical protein
VSNTRPIQLPIVVESQPDEVSCGPTCLHGIYRYYGDSIALADVLGATQRLAHGGTLAVLLAHHALQRGYQARIYSCNLQVFDPTWFNPRGHRHPGLLERLSRSAAFARDERQRLAVEAYVNFLRAGGDLQLRAPSPQLIARHLARGQPLIAGLSSTWLYREPRMSGDQDDDLLGEPQGHFVVIAGQDPRRRRVWLADPLPTSKSPAEHDSVSLVQLQHAIALGIVTYDANLLVIFPRGTR